MKSQIKDVRKKFGLKVRKLRSEKGFSQEEFAFECNLHRTYVGAIERGERNISIDNISKIADALKIKISELLDGKIALENISTELQNNFVSLCVDRNVNEQILSVMLSKFSQYKPKHVRTDFNIFEAVQLSATELNEVSIDIDTALHEFVNLLDIFIGLINFLCKIRNIIIINIY
jgi:transcriptional regulator with XRE-family HTH domain